MILRRIKNRLKFERKELPLRINFLLRLYKYNPDRYKGTFLYDLQSNKPVQSFPKPTLNEVVYCFWTGHNAMSANRQRCLASMKENIGVPLILITPDNLQEYILDSHPLHEAYPYLSNVHKSDYLRAYFMHHHGGGYADIKLHHGYWPPIFKKLKKCKNAYLIGYHEKSADVVAPVEGILGQDLRTYYRYLLGNCSYICKPYTPFTTEWIRQQNIVLDEKFDEIKENPGNIMGDNPGYPLKWTELLGNIFHPLCLKYHRNLLYANELRYTTAPYR